MNAQGRSTAMPSLIVKPKVKLALSIEDYYLLEPLMTRPLTWRPRHSHLRTPNNQFRHSLGGLVPPNAVHYDDNNGDQP